MVRSIRYASLSARLFMVLSCGFVAPVSSTVGVESQRDDDQNSVAVQADVAATERTSTGEDAERDQSPEARADERRERALMAIKRKGGRVEFRHQVDLAAGDVTLEQLLEIARYDSYVKVRSVYLSDSAVDDDLQAIVAGLPEVGVLSLNGTSISDAGMAIIRDLRELTMLDLRGTKVTGAGLAHLNAHANLRSLYLDDTQVAADDLVHLRGLKSLQRLGLNATEITDDDLQHLAQLRQLKELRLQDTHITSAGLRFLEGLPNVEELQVDEIVLSHEGQVALSRMKSLKRLILPPHPDANQPDDWSNLDQLRGQLDLRIRDALYEEVIGADIERRQ
jgi:hypothetical protein